MRRIALALVAAMFCGSALAEPPAPEQLDADPFRALAEIKTRNDIWDRSFDSLYEQMLADFRADPKFVQADGACPGFVDAIAQAARPFMRDGHFKQREPYRAGLARIFRSGLTASQASEAIAFYASDDGRYLLELGTDSTSQQAKIGQGTEPLSRENFDADLARTREDAVAKAEPVIRERAEATLARSSWYDPYVAINPQVQQLRFEITRMRDPDTLERRAAMDAAIRRTGVQHFANCGRAVPLPNP